MKIEIEIDDKLFNSEGEENPSWNDQIRAAVVQELVNRMTPQITHSWQIDINCILTDFTWKLSNKLVPELTNDILDSEYAVTTIPGLPPKMTTFRKELLKTIGENLVYKKANTLAEKNAFTRAVDGVVAESIKQFRVEFDDAANTKFRTEVVDYVLNSLTKESVAKRKKKGKNG